jgi:Mg-chelatase subunit ChlD
MTTTASPATNDERLRRWRLILGGGACDGTGCSLGGADLGLDSVLAQLYGGADMGCDDDGQPKSQKDRTGGLGGSRPNVARWLGDIRQYFPRSIVQIMQRDALERLNLHQMLMEPEMLEAVEADVQLVGTLMSLRGVMPEKTKDSARQVIKKVVDELIRKLAAPTRQAVTGAINRSSRDNRRPRHAEIDWNRTIRKNLKHYQPEYKTVIPERLIGYGRKRSSVRDIILCVDQSGSMAGSVVYSGIFGAVMASLPTVHTQMVVFDTAVVDLTEKMDDPVELLFGIQLGGGTDINKALGYCQGLVTRPNQTIFVLISDLYEGGSQGGALKKAAAMVASGVKMIALLALDDKGSPSYDHEFAQKLASFGVPSFACTPELFPDLMAEAINRGDLAQWAGERNLTVTQKKKK